MKVLFISSVCSRKKYDEIFYERKEKKLDPQQKFCRLLIEGIGLNEITQIECLTALPVSANTIATRVFGEEIEKVSNSITYHYVGFKNGKLSRYSSLYKNFKRQVKNWIIANKNEDKIIICDALEYAPSRAAQDVAKRLSVKTIGIVTDLPHLTTTMKQRKVSLIKRLGLHIYQKLTTKSLMYYDAYIVLTKSIEEEVNKDGKPLIIVEGSVDSSIEPLHLKNKQKIILYAGGIYEKYGVKNLVEAFIQANIKDYELHIYGEGTYVNELVTRINGIKNIKYMGVVSSDDIFEMECKASLLVNPRPVEENFSKYSFPSKTLEYMASGTPLLTTKLSGIPEDYYSYLIKFEGDDIKSMTINLKQVCLLKDDELQKIGERAQKFVLENKNNIIQGKKIVNFIQMLTKTY